MPSSTATARADAGAAAIRAASRDSSSAVPLQNVATGPELRISIRLRDPVVLVDHTAEHLQALHRRIKRHDGRLVVIGWPLLPGLMRPVPVSARVGAQHSPE